MNYSVKWEIDIEAVSPVEAAREALRIQRDDCDADTLNDSANTATVFDVTDEAGVVTRVDLLRYSGCECSGERIFIGLDHEKDCPAYRPQEPDIDNGDVG